MIPKDGYLNVRVLASIADPEMLRNLFEDETATRKMTVKENGNTVATYEGYTEFYSTEDRTPEAETAILESSVRVVKIQAQSLNDTDALTVQNLYPEWSGKSVTYAKDFKVNRNGVLYKCLQDHVSQESWSPEDAPSLWAKVLIPDPETIPEWEQPGSTNGYSKGDKTTHNGKTWESLVDNNVWEPGVTGTETVWKEVSA